jgi:RHS repeat-associated protein
MSSGAQGNDGIGSQVAAGASEASSGARENASATSQSVSKAASAISGLRSGQTNIVDAAFAVKDAFDSVKGLTGKISESAMMPVMKALGAFKGQATMPAGKQMDPIMGIDVHMVTIPPSPAPVPLPHPYIGMLFNPKDWVSCMVNTVKTAALDALPKPKEGAKGIGASLANKKEAIANIAMGLAGLSASVKFGPVIPRAITGTKTKNVPHIPFGAGWHPAFAGPVAKNVGKAFLGSLFVVADGDPMVGSFHLNYDCWDVGVVDLFKSLRKGGGKTPDPGGPQTELFVPSGTVMPIPLGRPVLVNSIPTPINPLAILDKLFKAGLGKLKKLAAKGLHGLVNKFGKGGPFSTGAHAAICFATGHPVDVVSGRLFSDAEDFSLPGIIPLEWQRRWYSDSEYTGPLGHGWHHSYDMGFAVDPENDSAAFKMEDGRIAFFSLPADRESSYDRSNKLHLHYNAEEKFYYITDTDELIYRFTPKTFKNEITGAECQLIQSIANRNGYAIRFEYTDKGLLSKIIDSAGRILSIENDNKGRITAIHAPHPEWKDKAFVIAKYEYDDHGNMVCQTDALEQKMKFEYENHLLLKETWRDGQEWHFEYNGKTTGSKCIHTWGDGDLYNHKLNYQPGLTVVENSLGHLTTYYHKGDLVSRKIDANGAEWGYNYNRYNDLDWEIDPLGNQEVYTHDEWGNVTSHTDAAGGFSTIDYNHPLFPHFPTEITDAVGAKWKWEYDDHGKLVSVMNPMGAKTIYQYEDGLLKSVIGVEEDVVLLEYDRHQNIKRIQTRNGGVTDYEHNILGNCIAIRNPNLVTQTLIVDLKGRVKTVNDFDGNLINLEYDGIDNLTRYKDNQREVVLSYRGLWKLTRRTEAGSSIIYKYNTEEQLVKVINEHNVPYTFELDSVGNIVREFGFDGRVTSYNLNAAGQVVQINRPGGKINRYEFDPCGRVTAVHFNDTLHHFFAYRADGLLTMAVNDDVKIEIQRDISGNVFNEAANEEWIRSEYDQSGNRVKVTSRFGADIIYGYNGIGELANMQANGWKASFKYNTLGFEIERILPGKVFNEWKYDGAGRPIFHLVSRQGMQTALTRHKKYLWDVNLCLKAIQDSKGAVRFDYNKKNFLSKTIFENEEEQLRNPDAVSNLFKTSNRDDRLYELGGKLKKINGWEYLYDAEGNLIERKHIINGKSWKYFWNDANLLVKVVRPDYDEVNFKYDALGRRVSKQYKNTITKFVWDGDVPLHEWKECVVTGEKLSDLKIGTNGLTTWIWNDVNNPTAKIKGEKRYSIVTDHLGTPCQMYTEQGELFWNCELDSYGDIRMEKGEIGSCPFRYPGQYHDPETELYYNRSRYYSPETGNYISPDPIGVMGGLTVYSYVPDVNIYIDRPGVTPAYGIAGYGQEEHKGDGLEAHELLQNAHLRQNGHGNYNNPAIALPPTVHREVSQAQKDEDLHKPSELKKQSMIQNINANAKILLKVLTKQFKKTMSPGKARRKAQKIVAELKRKALAYARKK